MKWSVWWIEEFELLQEKPVRKQVLGKCLHEVEFLSLEFKFFHGPMLKQKVWAIVFSHFLFNLTPYDRGEL